MTAAAIRATAPDHFRASWPRHLDPSLQSLCTKTARVFWTAVKVLLFPLLLIEWGASRIRSQLFSKALLPGAHWLRRAGLGYVIRGREEKIKMGGQTVQMTAPDGVKLEGMFFEGSKPDRAILYIGGNAEEYKILDNAFILQMLATGASLLMIDPRTVGDSQHQIPDEKGLSLDVWTAYSYLIQKKGLHPESILGIGSSMGGALVNLGAAVVQKEYPEQRMSVINLRSFSKLSNTAEEILKQQVFPHNPFIARLGKYALRMVGCEIDSEAALRTLKGRKTIFSVSTDDVIYPHAQMQHSLRLNPPPHTHFVEMQSTGLDGDHARPFLSEERQQLRLHMNQALKI